MKLSKSYSTLLFSISFLASIYVFGTEPTKSECCDEVTVEHRSTRCIEGHVVSSQGMESLKDAEVKLIDDVSKTIRGVFRPNPNTGKMVFTFEEGTPYTVVVSAPLHDTKVTHLIIHKEDDMGDKLTFKLNRSNMASN